MENETTPPQEESLATLGMGRGLPESLRKKHREALAVVGQTLAAIAVFANEQWERGYPNDTFYTKRLTIEFDENQQYRVRMQGYGLLRTPLARIAYFARQFRDKEVELERIQKLPGLQFARIDVYQNPYGKEDEVRIIIEHISK